MIGTVIVSGVLIEEAFQDAGIPFSAGTWSRLMASTIDETAIMRSTTKVTQAVIRAAK